MATDCFHKLLGENFYLILRKSISVSSNVTFYKETTDIYLKKRTFVISTDFSFF